MMLVGEDDRWWVADFSKTFGAARAPHAHRRRPRRVSAAATARDHSAAFAAAGKAVGLRVPARVMKSCSCGWARYHRPGRSGRCSSGVCKRACRISAQAPRRQRCCLGNLPDDISRLWLHACTWAQLQAFRHAHARRTWLRSGCALLCKLCQLVSCGHAHLVGQDCCR
jgi:hypothetical protein